MGVIDATLAIDLAQPLQTLHSGRDRTTPQLIRQAAQRGITIREGDRSDIETFFALMLDTCHRQQVKPNPDSAQRLQDLWDAFRHGTGARLTFAEALLAGKPVPEEYKQGRDIFNLSFGGQPFLLPPPYVHFASFPLRSAYRLAVSSRIPDLLRRHWPRRKRATS